MKDTKSQIFIAKGFSPWFNGNLGNDYYECMDIWEDSSHVVSVDESVPGQATVTCDGNITNMSSMFNLTHITSLDLSSFDASNVTNMRSMFEGCLNLTSLDLSNFDTSNVTNMSTMFCNCTNLTTIKGVIAMKSCTECYCMFKNCSKLKNVQIKNPPANFDAAGLSKSQYTIVS